MSKYHRHRRTNFRLIRTLIGIIASFLILFSVKTAQPDFITMFATTAFAVPSFGLTFIGSVISYWKRRFGAVIMFGGLLFGCGLLPFGGLVMLALLMILFCIISSYWHVIQD